MRNIYLPIARVRNLLLAFMVLLIVSMIPQSSYGQIRKEFKPRESSKAAGGHANKPNYFLQGDFAIIGNTNLTPKIYGNGVSNQEEMIYVDTDDHPYSINSSSANLELKGANCSEIIYAGLYWSGRAHDEGPSPDSFSVTNYIPVKGPVNTVNAKVYHDKLQNGFKLTITKVNATTGGIDNYYPSYAIELEGHETIYFQIRNDDDYRTKLHHKIGEGNNWRNLPVASYSNTNGVLRFRNDFTIPLGKLTLTIREIGREPRRDRNADFTTTKNYVEMSIKGEGISHYIVDERAVDKRKVHFRKTGNGYTQITANDNDIWYPSNADENMYAAYADVTDYVRKHGTGEYTVADLAVNEGKGGTAGFYGGWSMVVVYKNPGLNWRNITVFDGYGYISAKDKTPHSLPIKGFVANKRGNVGVTLGMMAGEGDVAVKGDYFEIQKLNTSEFVRLKHQGNTEDNFFNSSIQTGGNQRTPNLLNNTGMDIVRFDLDNTLNSTIGNGQTQTQFRFGTDGDTYIIYNMVFAVDELVPEAIGHNVLETTDVKNKGTVNPGKFLDFSLNMYNKGFEDTKDLTAEVRIPPNMHYVSNSVVPGSDPNIKIPNNTTVQWIPPQGAPQGAKPASTPGGTLRWTIGQLPEDESRNIMQGSLKYRLKVTQNCALIVTAGACFLDILVDGQVKGKGAISESDFSSSFVREYQGGACQKPVYGPYEFDVVLDKGYLNTCGFTFTDGYIQFVADCAYGSLEYKRDDITQLYTEGTKFFSEVPSSYDSNTGLVTGSFAFPADGSKRKYYAMNPGMANGCYAKLEVSGQVINSSPTAKNVEFCKGQDVVLEVELSKNGKDKGFKLYYFTAQDQTTPLESIPAPTQVGVHTYWVAEGKIENKKLCIGPKVSFTVTILKTAEVDQSVPSDWICRNFEYSVTVTTDQTTDLKWEYSEGDQPTEWKTLTDSSFPGIITTTGATLRVLYARKDIDSKVFRLVVNSNSKCPVTSNEFNISVFDCSSETNPTLPHRSTLPKPTNEVITD